MSSGADRAIALYRTNSRYRRWFKKWWAADFSITGKKSSLARNNYVPRHEFAGRTWPVIWGPPHDLDGNLNTNFLILQPGVERNHWWQHVRSSLAGSFIREIPRDLSIIPSDLSFCCFSGTPDLSFRESEINISDVFATESLNVNDYPHSANISARSIVVCNDLQFSKPVHLSYALDKSIIMGNCHVDSDSSEGQFQDLIVIGDFRTRGRISGSRLKGGSLFVSGLADRQGGIALKNSKLASLSVSGGVSAIECIDSSLGTVSISVPKCESLTLSGCHFVTL